MDGFVGVCRKDRRLIANQYNAGSTPVTYSKIVASIGMRLGFINPGEWSDGLQR